LYIESFISWEGDNTCIYVPYVCVIRSKAGFRVWRRGRKTKRRRRRRSAGEGREGIGVVWRWKKSD
jgi:hypothetical protein